MTPPPPFQNPSRNVAKQNKIKFENLVICPLKKSKEYATKYSFFMFTFSICAKFCTKQYDWEGWEDYKK